MNSYPNSIKPFGKVSLSFTAEAICFLSETTNGTSHFAILGQLIKNTSVTPSSTSKRGNVITLDVSQVECSVHSCCAQFGIGRKKFETIMRQMEQHGIIRMHRSRLATIADMTCITSWLLPNGNTMSNGIDGRQADHSTDGQPNDTDATSHDSSHINDGKADASFVIGSQTPSDTDRSSAPEATEYASTKTTPVVPSQPIDNTPGQLMNRGCAAVIASDLFAGQDGCDPSQPHTQNGYQVESD